MRTVADVAAKSLPSDLLPEAVSRIFPLPHPFPHSLRDVRRAGRHAIGLFVAGPELARLSTRSRKTALRAAMLDVVA